MRNFIKQLVCIKQKQNLEKQRLNLGKNWVVGINGDDRLRCINGEGCVGEYEKVLFALGSVSGEKEFVEIEGRVRVGLWRRGKPVNGERRPLKRVRNEEIV